VRLCFEPQWANPREYTGNAGNPAGRNPAAPENQSTTLFPSGIPLVAGQMYFFEALAKEAPEAERGPAARALGRRLRHGDVGAHAVQRVQHGGLRVLDAVRGCGHGDHQADAERQAQRDEDRLAHPPPQLAPYVGEEHAAMLVRGQARVVSPRNPVPLRPPR